MAECQDDLDVLDQNCDGKIKASELGSLVEDLGAPKGEDGLQKLHTETDVEKGGTIGTHEVLATQMRDKGFKDELLEAFKVFDKNNDGFIAMEEMKQVMDNLGQHLTDQELEETIRECDMNGDGKVDYNEFVEMMDSLFTFIEATMASS